LGFEVLRTQQANCFVAEDGRRPFKLAPEYFDVSILFKNLHSQESSKVRHGHQKHGHGKAASHTSLKETRKSLAATDDKQEDTLVNGHEVPMQTFHQEGKKRLSTKLN
jgi:hypothetical protein